MQRPLPFLSVLFLPLVAQVPYQNPPKVMVDIVTAPGFPSFLVSPTGTKALLVEQERNPPIRDLARPMLRLAGTRMDPVTRGPHTPGRTTSIKVMSLPSATTQDVVLPKGVLFSSPRWSPDGTSFVLTGTTTKAVELYLGDVASGKVRKVPGLRVNSGFGNALDWVGSKTLLVKAVPANPGAAPKAPEAPAGPRVQENLGKAAPVPTLQDLLQNAHDEALFTFYATSQLMTVDSNSLATHPVGKPALLDTVTPSPDGKHILVSTLHRPYSYQVGQGRFPHRFEVWNLQGKVLRAVHEHGLLENIPLDGVPTGPRNLGWVPTEPATLQWVEALDGGNPKTEAPARDRIMLHASPFASEPKELLRTEHRFQGLVYGEKGDFALLRENDRKRQWNRTWFLNPKAPTSAKLVFDLSARDRYKDPGQPVMTTLASGNQVIRQEGRTIFLSGTGASPKGDRPFLDRLDLDTLKTERLFQCRDGWYETASLQKDGTLLVRRENQTTPPNTFLRLKDGKERALTHQEDPAPILRKVRKQLVTYKRPDGVELSFTMYLPPDHKDGDRHPTLIWAYPQEFTSVATASQVSGNTDRFTLPGATSHLLMALAGYVVLDNATMPVVGDPETVNNTFLEQVIASAKAAIDKATDLGVTDPKRVAVGGHSYGAFMTANLLAHSQLFRAGIARSGAYNRTLTPFGFQSEQRTLWEAKDMYLKVSPFMFANTFKAPILLIHGEMDNNQGTFPIQSERLFQALRGNGKVVRYVTLPHESHGYAARESSLHTLWEMVTWLDKHLQ